MAMAAWFRYDVDSQSPLIVLPTIWIRYSVYSQFHAYSALNQMSIWWCHGRSQFSVRGQFGSAFLRDVPVN
jgi:hypothetical protein